jgi:hypothetical protein
MGGHRATRTSGRASVDCGRDLVVFVQCEVYCGGERSGGPAGVSEEVRERRQNLGEHGVARRVRDRLVELDVCLPDRSSHLVRDPEMGQGASHGKEIVAGSVGRCSLGCGGLEDEPQVVELIDRVIVE